MAAAMIGKIKTTTQMIAIIYLLFEPLFVMIFEKVLPAVNAAPAIYMVGDIAFLISVIMTILSGMDYLIKNIHYFKENA
jgi:CDP-diacylglycerol--glycerol-3-phosphate 3-phosphatidyltransferase/cardiolipin synthase